jgi:transposase-like protein
MKNVVRYSESFKRQVVREIEDGTHPSCFSASKAYGIFGGETVYRWVGKYGKTHLLKRVVRVETTEERSELKKLREEVRELKSALADAHLDLLLEEAFLDIACEKAGIEDIEAFKKKANTELSKRRSRNLHRRKE